jgi:hypothetical protein
MTIDQFRRHKYLSSEWRTLMRTSAILQRVLLVMEENHPARFAIRGDGNDDLSPTRAALELGLTRGYSKYADALQLLSQPIKQTENIGEPTYEKETHAQETPP